MRSITGSLGNWIWMKKNNFLIYFAVALAIIVVTLPFVPQRTNSTLPEKPKTERSSISTTIIVDINKASIKELESLPHIGPAIAQKIIDYRSKTPFESISDIMKVKGIGEKTFDRIKDRIIVKNAKPLKKHNSKININTASLDGLTSLKGIGRVYAQRIIDYRNKHRFNTISDIMKVKGIGEKTFDRIKDRIEVKDEQK